jgi:hypothetical protein
MRLEDMKEKPTARRKAYIVSAGVKDRPTYTMHSFRDAVLAPDPEKGWLHPQWDLMYSCDVTGAQRKFGVIDATDITERNQRTEEVM